METLPTADGAAIGADVAPATSADRRGVAVLCHPHPTFGGNRFHPLIDALFTTLPSAGWSTVRFDFRVPPEVGADRVAAADLAAAIDRADRGRSGELVVVGYSYGAVAALRSHDARLSRIVAIAPPLAALDRRPVVPTLLLTPEHDQFTPPDAAARLSAPWPAVTRSTIPSTDHFLLGQVSNIVRMVTEWLAGPTA